MKKMLLLLLLFPTLAFAHDDPTGLCKCQLLERLPEWIALHDEWWSCNVALHEQQREYARCLGAVRERESTLSKKARKRYVPYQENKGIFSYVFPQHPTEDAANNIPASAEHVLACEVQLAADFIPSVLQCSAHLQYLRGLR